MFRALLSYPQEVLYKRHLVYYVRVMSVGCTRIEVKPECLRSSAHVFTSHTLQDIPRLRETADNTEGYI
jgi:hypothetical protein